MSLGSLQLLEGKTLSAGAQPWYSCHADLGTLVGHREHTKGEKEGGEEGGEEGGKEGRREESQSA